ncbi:MAG: hypothetical protein KKH01_05485 [Firmicutes bacterium]|nr:hypothetical protein [Bacillota bacterium]
MKKLMRVVFLFLFALVLVSCKDIAITLDTPQNVVITDGVISWDAVTDADSYMVFVDTDTYTVTVTTFDLNTLDLAVGTYPVQIVAMQGTNISSPSTTVNFVVEPLVVGVPQNVAIASGIVTWSAIAGATGYTVHVGSDTYDVTVTTFDLTTLSLAQGNYPVYVVAKIGTDVSTASTTVSYFVGGTTLDVPQNVTISNGIVTWSAVSGADSYIVYVDAVSHPVTLTTFDLTTLELLSGDHEVFVVAIAGTDTSAASVTVNYFIESYSTLYEDLLYVMNPMYEPDMILDDFETVDEYIQYMQMSQLVYAYSIAADEMGMTEIEAVGLFSYIASTPMRMGEINNVTTLMAEIDSYSSFDLSSTDLATILYELAQVAVTLHVDDLENIILEQDAYIAEIEDEIAVNQIAVTADLASIYANLSLYASTEEMVQLNYFLSGQYEESYMVLNTLSQMAWDLEYDFEFHYPYYLDYEDEYIQMFYNIFTDAAIAEDYTLLNAFIIGDPLSSLYTLLYDYESIMYANEDIIRREDEILLMGELKAFMIDEKDLMIESITSVIDYLSLMYDTVPASMVTLLDDLAENGELTMAEYFMLKDEVVDVLITTLPSSEDFASMYTTLITVAGAFDVTLDDLLPYVDFFGEVDHATLDLALTFVADLDQTTVEEVMAIVDQLMIPGEYVYDEYWDEWYYEDDTVDFEKAIELAVYVGTYLEEFKLNNIAKFDTLDALMTDAQVKSLVLLLGEAVKDAMMLETSTSDYELAVMIIDEILANYDNFIAAADIANAIGMNLVDEFLTTEGQMLIDLYNLVNAGEGDLADPTYQAQIEALLAQMMNYKAAIIDELDATSIETLLTLVRIPLKIQLLMVSTIDPADIDDLLDAGIVPLSAMLDLFVTFVGYVDETAIMDVVLLGNDLMIPGAYVDDGFGGYYEPDTLDFEVAVDLAVYIGTYLDTFKLSNTAKFDAVSALFTDGDVFDLLTIFTDLFLSQVEGDMDVDQFAMLSMLIDEVLADYDNIIAALNVMGSLGMAVVDEFLTTEGQLLLDIYDIALNGGDLSDPLFVVDVQSIIAQAFIYNGAITDELDLTSIQALLRLVRIPLKIQISSEGTMDAADVDLMFNALLVPVSTVILNAITLETQLFSAVNGLDIASHIVGWNITGEDEMMALVVLALDGALTPTNEALVFSTITIIQNDILKNADVLVLSNNTALDVDTMIGEVVTDLTDLFAEIHTVALLDFTAMDQTDIDQLHALFDMVMPVEEPPLT